jgi:hypothetical protein
VALASSIFVLEISLLTCAQDAYTAATDEEKHQHMVRVHGDGQCFSLNHWHTGDDALCKEAIVAGSTFVNRSGVAVVLTIKPPALSLIVEMMRGAPLSCPSHYMLYSMTSRPSCMYGHPHER